MQRRLPPELKKSIALQAISGSNITQLAQKLQVCRNTVYKQKLLAQTTINEVFLAPVLDNQVLFDLPVTKDFLRQVVLGMLLICKASYRDVQMFLRDVFDTSISIGPFPISVMMPVIRPPRLMPPTALMPLDRVPLMRSITITNLIWWSLISIVAFARGGLS